MSFGLAGIFAEAAALWRGDRDLWIRLAAVFFFLPGLALALFVAPLDESAAAPDAAPEAAAQAMLDWLSANIGWIGCGLLVQALGSCVVLVLLLDPARPTIGQAIGRGLRLLPGYVLVSLGATLMVIVGLFAFVLPGLYALGRTVVTGAAYVAEPGRGPLGALVEGIRRTENRGWMLLLVVLTLVAVNYLALGLLGGLGAALGAGAAGSPFVRVPFELLTSAVGAAMALAQALVQAAAYRRLEAPRQGI